MQTITIITPEYFRQVLDRINQAEKTTKNDLARINTLHLHNQCNLLKENPQGLLDWIKKKYTNKNTSKNYMKTISKICRHATLNEKKMMLNLGDGIPAAEVEDQFNQRI